MRIEEINIQRYGPLSGVGWEIDDGIQAIYGPNESGKTLAVEALMKMLVGSEGYLPDDANRVKEKPEGFIMVRTDDGKKKVNYDNPLCEQIDVDPDDLLKTLVVRNTDLQIDDEDKFYERVSDKLSGLWTEGIRRIEGKLREIGRLTKTLRLKDNAPMNYPKTQLNDAKKLKGDIEDYIGKAEEEGIKSIESKRLSAESEKVDLKREQRVLKIGRLEECLSEAKGAMTELSELPSSEDVSGLREELGRIGGITGDSKSIERNIELYKIFTIGSVIGSLISLIAFLFIGNISLIILGVFLISSLFSGILYQKENSKLSDSAQDIERTIRFVQRKGVELEGRNQTKKLENLPGTLDGIDNKRNDFERKIDQNLGILKDEFEISEKIDRLESIDKAEKILGEKKAELELSEEIQYDKERLKEIEKRLEEIEGNLDEWNEALSKHEKALDGFSTRANELDFNYFAGEKIDLEINNLESLEMLVEELSRFVDEIEDVRDCSKCAVEIFRNIESEEERKISELFGEDSETTRIFEEITGGRYEKVGYDQDKGEIYVENESEEVFYPSIELSGSRGTVDQLYLSIRMALAQEVLETGSFFLLDDALVFSDNSRTERQHEILNSFSEMGWQVIYFTSNEDIADSLGDLTGNEYIKLGERL